MESEGAGMCGGDCVMGTWTQAGAEGWGQTLLRVVLGSLGEAWGGKESSKAESAESINRSSKQRTLEKGTHHYGENGITLEEKFICSYIVELNFPPSEGMEMISYYKPFYIKNRVLAFYYLIL